ncbi:MAG: glycine zipper family protein [bacterium]
MNKIILIALASLALAACASYRPVVDTKGVDMNKYHVDLGECQQYAGQVDPGEHAAVGAAAGAVLGAAIGAIFGNRQTAGQGAAAYGLLGAAGGGAEGATSQRDIIKRCMAGRGYRVLY